MAQNSKQLVLGVDGGATKTDWVLCESTAAGLTIVESGRLGASNMKTLAPGALLDLLACLPITGVTHAGVYLAGCATEADRKSLHMLCSTLWPHVDLFCGNDRESGFAAALGNGDGIAVIAGTGSAVTGRKGSQEERASGWGHLLGDSGGGYDLAIRALRQVLYDFDTRRFISPLARDILSVLCLNSLRDLTDWAQSADKTSLARLTPLVFTHADDSEMTTILNNGAQALADYTLAVAGRLQMQDPAIRLLGGVFLSQPGYVEKFTSFVKRHLPAAEIAPATSSSAMGAALLAVQNFNTPTVDLSPAPDEDSLRIAPTEQTNPRSEHLSTMQTNEIVDLFISEEKQVENALRECHATITLAAEIVAETIKSGGRLFYIGAGTSGRLGVLDASEIPPTFGVETDLVQGIIAGGAAALSTSIEGAEDSRESGALLIASRGVQPSDVVCGIAASGRTPFVFGALNAAQQLGARTLLLTCNPSRDKTCRFAECEIDLPTGPEILTGSTRLKAGTATKIVLNILSTTAMIRLGRVSGNSMACMKASNSKLRERAVRIVSHTIEVSEEEARSLLMRANWDIPEVVFAHSRENRMQKQTP